VSKVTKLEDKILEFKSRDYFGGKDEEIAMKICTDLKNKLKEPPYKIYLIGVEDDGTIGFIPDSRIKSDRLENIRQKIKQESHVTHLYLIPVKCGDNGNILILIGGKGENGSGA
jgi:GTPase